MPICPTCGKKIALSWQMEKHQKSSRCKLHVKTKELERVSGDLHVMCGNVEKLQAALIALEKEHRPQQPYLPDAEMQKNMEKIMNKLQEIWALIKHEAQEIHSSEHQPANFSIASSTLSTDNSPILSETQTVQSVQPLSPENGNQSNTILSPADRVSLMRSELKEYFKQTRPSVIKLAESHQVPHLIEIFSKLASADVDEPDAVLSEQKIIPVTAQTNQTVNILQQSSDSHLTNAILKDETINPDKAISYQMVKSADVPSEVLIRKDILTQPQTVSISSSQQTEFSLVHSEDEKILIPNPIAYNSHNQNVNRKHLSISTTQNDSSESIGGLEKWYNAHDIGTQTTIMSKHRKPHSAKALGK